MARKKYTTEQIIKMLREAEVLQAQGQTVVQVIRQHGVAELSRQHREDHPAHELRLPLPGEDGTGQQDPGDLWQALLALRDRCVRAWEWDTLRHQAHGHPVLGSAIARWRCEQAAGLPRTRLLTIRDPLVAPAQAGRSVSRAASPPRR